MCRIFQRFIKNLVWLLSKFLKIDFYFFSKALKGSKDDNFIGFPMSICISSFRFQYFDFKQMWLWFLRVSNCAINKKCICHYSPWGYKNTYKNSFVKYQLFHPIFDPGDLFWAFFLPKVYSCIGTAFKKDFQKMLAWTMEIKLIQNTMCLLNNDEYDQSMNRQSKLTKRLMYKSSFSI